MNHEHAADLIPVGNDTACTRCDYVKCHCGWEYNGMVDHCPECFCEQFEETRCNI